MQKWAMLMMVLDIIECQWRYILHGNIGIVESRMPFTFVPQHIADDISDLSKAMVRGAAVAITFMTTGFIKQKFHLFGVIYKAAKAKQCYYEMTPFRWLKSLMPYSRPVLYTPRLIFQPQTTDYKRLHFQQLHFDYDLGIFRSRFLWFIYLSPREWLHRCAAGHFHAYLLLLYIIYGEARKTLPRSFATHYY